MSFGALKAHLDTFFPRIWKQIDHKKVTAVLLIQVKGGDVHSNNRDPAIIGNKTQIDVTGSSTVSSTNPTTVLFSSAVAGSGLNWWPVKAWDSTKWVNTHIKVSSDDQAPPSAGQQRIKLGGTDPNRWSTIVWEKMGHYRTDPFSFILFIREGLTAPPLSFSLPDHTTLRDLLRQHGNLSGDWGPSVANMPNTPRSKSAVIMGPWASVSTTTSVTITAPQFLYVATNPDPNGKRVGWVKVGKTKREPIDRLKEYDDAWEFYDMNHIRMTSDCHNAEKDAHARLDSMGYERKTTIIAGGKTEWFNIGSIDPAVSCIDNVVKMFPYADDSKLEPIIRSTESWAYSSNMSLSYLRVLLLSAIAIAAYMLLS